MERNFFRRVEIAFPVLDRRLKKRVVEEALKPYLKDNQQAWLMDSEGHYRRLFARTTHYSAQNFLLGKLKL
jgi:polyphosphate kinase